LQNKEHDNEKLCRKRFEKFPEKTDETPNVKMDKPGGVGNL
jgi:hypothetical protein